MKRNYIYYPILCEASLFMLHRLPLEEDDTEESVDTDNSWTPDQDQLDVEEGGSIDIDSTFIPAQPAWFRKQKRYSSFFC